MRVRALNRESSRQSIGHREQPIRIAYVVHTFGFGGLERIVAQLASALDCGQFSPLIVCLRSQNGAEQWLERSDVPIVELHKPTGNDLGTIRQLINVFRQHRVHLVHCHNWGTLLESWLAAKTVRIPLIHAQHGLEPQIFESSRLKSPLRRIVMSALLNSADAVVAVARSVEWYLASRCRVARKKLLYLPNGVACVEKVGPRDRCHLRLSCGIPASAFVFGSVGRLAWVKDFATAIRAFAIVSGKVQDAHFLLVGDGPERQALVNLVSQLGIQDRVHFAGARPDGAKYLQAMDAYVNSSVSEAMNLGLLEAMAAGLPIVATDVGDNAFLVGGEKPAGFVVPPRAVQAMAEAMLAVAENQRLCREFSASAYQRWALHYRLETMVNNYRQLYRSVCFKRRRSASLTRLDGSN